MWIRGCEVGGRGPLDVRIEGGRIAALGTGLAPARGVSVLDAHGGALLPGLHDHHLHLRAMAAAARSVRCGPPEVEDPEALRHALEGASAQDGWIRGVGYHESVAGDLERDRLDALLADRPVRIQHRSGAAWLLNSRGCERLGLDRRETPAGVERDASGRATGRLFRLDAWLRDQLGPSEAPALDSIGRELASYGVTGVTDATVSNGRPDLEALVAAAAAGWLPQYILVMGRGDLPAPEHASVERGPLKVMLAESDLPTPEELEATIRDAHDAVRPVAIHCVTRVEAVFAAAALRTAGSRVGDRIEHASIAPPELVALLASLPVTVVTQPGFIHERGDAYRSEVEPADRPWLYRARAWLESRVPLGGGTDAPFGDPDPWRAMRAAVERRTRAGAVLGAEERLTPEQALALFTTPPDAPGGPSRRVAVGEPADLCLLDRAWRDAREDLSGEHVVTTVRAGRPIWSAETHT